LVAPGEQRLLPHCELPPIGVLVPLAPRGHALLVARACRFGQLALEVGLHTRAVDFAQPRLRLLRPLGRPELEHLAAPAQRLAHRSPAVHLLARHLGTSWKPSATSRASQPAASICARSRSASSKSRAARACRRRSASSTISGGASAVPASDARPKTASARR